VNETVLTMIGNIASDLRHAQTKGGVPVTTFRLASTTRRFDRGRGQWADVDTVFVTVVCWRALAEHVASSCAKGDPVVVTGRLRQRAWEADDGRSGTSDEVEAFVVGHDLNRGTSAFQRAARSPSVEQPDRSVADELALEVAREPLPTADAGEAAA